MPKKIQDITAKPETPQDLPNQEIPVQPEMPEEVEVEKKIEVEKAPTFPTEGAIGAEQQEAVMPAQVIAPAAPQPPVKSPTLEKIENILQEDLQDIYFQLPPKKQAEFREVGEETATRIAKMMSGVKIHVKKILELIINWLKIIPGLNRYFLEQEAKIKTDEILKLKQDQKQSNSGGDQNKI